MGFIDLFKNKGSNNYKLVPYQKRINPRNKLFMQIAKDLDKEKGIPYDIGMELENIFDLDNYFIGIHRTGFTIIDDVKLKNYFTNGLVNNGQSFQGATNNSISLSDTVTPISSFAILIQQIKSCHGYNGSQGVLLIKIPKSYMNGEKPIYFNNDGIPVLLPEYIYGFIKVDDRNIVEIIHNPNYSDVHNYENDGLLYESGEYSGFSK